MLINTHKYKRIEYFRKHIKLPYIFESIRTYKGSNGSKIHAHTKLHNIGQYSKSIGQCECESDKIKRESRFGDQAAYFIFHSYNTMYEVPPIDNLYESNIISFGELARRRRKNNVKI